MNTWDMVSFIIAVVLCGIVGAFIFGGPTK